MDQRECDSCRSCLKNEEKSAMHFLFDNNMIANMLSKCTALMIVENDGFPAYICSSCHIKLADCNEFRLMCTTSQEIYQTTLIIKGENPDSNVPLTDKGILTDDKKIFTPVDEDVVKTEYIEEVDNNDSEEDEGYDMLGMENEDRSSDNSEEPNDDDEEYEKTKRKSTRVKKTKSKNKSSKVESKSKETKNYPCTKCKRIFYVERNLVGHLRTHDGLKPAFCHICNKEFSKWSAADIHVHHVHGNMPKNFICDVGDCNRAYTMNTSLQAHKRNVHKSPEEAAKQSSIAHICEQCGNTFSTSATLKKHSYIHSGVRPFACQICPKKFVTKHKLKEHMLRHEGVKNHVCPHCGLKKTTMHELRTHMKYHTREKSYECNFCPAVFNAAANRKLHIDVVHMGIKKFNCSHCDLSFGTRDTLKYHEMTHTGEKPHQCHVCEKRFIQPVALRRHLKTHKSR